VKERALPHIGPEAVKIGSADGNYFDSRGAGHPRSIHTQNWGTANDCHPF
jgi:hypothetical protein